MKLAKLHVPPSGTRRPRPLPLDSETSPIPVEVRCRPHSSADRADNLRSGEPMARACTATLSARARKSQGFSAGLVLVRRRQNAEPAGREAPPCVCRSGGSASIRRPTRASRPSRRRSARGSSGRAQPAGHGSLRRQAASTRSDCRSHSSSRASRTSAVSIAGYSATIRSLDRPRRASAARASVSIRVRWTCGAPDSLPGTMRSRGRGATRSGPRSSRVISNGRRSWNCCASRSRWPSVCCG
jgi:hypothetical protein